MFNKIFGIIFLSISLFMFRPLEGKYNKLMELTSLIVGIAHISRGIRDETK